MKEISTNEVEQLLKDNKNVNIIDVREDEEVATGKIPGSRHIRLGTIEDHKDELDKTEEYIFVCRSGRRSERAAKYFEDQGYKVSNMTGGMLAWEGEVE
ncbi:rhodanese-like domain-containing protein [Sediminibacillus massiliensis]|uniref:rhodanese-like domain-containing protein n=1 Tax=Sediminibacillus massiliensis TaxID=1926277 RepID=UPI00098835CE|nr:rhodanese-like domain-containing protein [Sediminibacillus massiliensis]